MGLKTLRGYQQDVIDGVNNAWLSVNNVLAVLSTGGGKSIIMSHVVAQFTKVNPEHVCLIFVHRNELVEQLSGTLADAGIYHGLICARATITSVTQQHRIDLGKVFYTDTLTPKVVVVSVDTFMAMRRRGTLPFYLANTALAIIDEAHHTLGDNDDPGFKSSANKWGECINALPDTCRVLGLTATPCRTDKKGLGAASHGIFHTMVEGVSMAWLIDNGFLSKYKVFEPGSAKYVRDQVKLAKREIKTKSGDFSMKVAESMVDTVAITGDVIGTYMKHAMGKQGITFAASIKHASHLCDEYNRRGVSAGLLQADMNALDRRRMIKQFRAGELLQLVNVDIASEGFDVPGVVCVSFVRPTMSLGLYRQQFGRALRILEGKECAFIFDHVGNVREHKLPEYPHIWELNVGAKRKKNVISDYALMTCEECDHTYELPEPECPECGWRVEAAVAREYRQVDGELIPLTDADIAELKQALHKIDLPEAAYKQWAINAAPHAAAAGNMVKHHIAAQDAQHRLRIGLHNWWVSNGLDALHPSVAASQFSQIFGLSTLDAMVLKPKEADKLLERVLTLQSQAA